MKFQDIEKELKERGFDESSGEWYQLKQGENRCRILTEFEPFGSHYVKKDNRSYICIGKDNNCPFCKEGDKPRVQFLGWVLDREDNEVKLAQFGYKIIKGISALASDEEFGFDHLPPYDILIKREGEKLKTEYTVFARKESPLTEEEQKLQADCKLIEDIIESMKEKVKEDFSISEDDTQIDENDKNKVDDLPFEKGI